MEDLSANLRALRARSDMSQDELAGALHVDRQTVSNWENGNNAPSFGLMVKIADYFGVTLDELVGRSSPVAK